MHRRFWHNHRENVILRDFPSPLPPTRKSRPELKDFILPENELRFQVSAATLSGGAMLLTDPMDQLLRNPEKAVLISQFLPHYEETECRPIDVFCGGRQPSLYHVPVHRDFEDWFVLGVFNWEDAYNDYTVPLSRVTGGGAWHAFEFWRHDYLGIHTRSLRVKDVPAHGCKVIALRRAQDRPQLLGTDMHLLQGAVDVRSVAHERNTLRIEIGHFMQKDRRMTIWHPSRSKAVRVETNARDHLVDGRRKNLLTIHFNGRRRTWFDIRWKER